MTLTKILEETTYIGIIYPDNSHISIRKTNISQVVYNETDGTVVLVESSKNTYSFGYEDVEDPNNLGYAFFSVYALWVYLMNMMNATITPPTPVYNVNIHVNPADSTVVFNSVTIPVVNGVAVITDQAVATYSYAVSRSGYTTNSGSLNLSHNMRLDIVLAVLPPFNIQYGRLYNYYATSNSNFTPVGWHIPTGSEFNTLISVLTPNEGSKLQESGLTYWKTYGIGTNSSGFNGRGAGTRTASGDWNTNPLKTSTAYRTSTVGSYEHVNYKLVDGVYTLNNDFRGNTSFNKSGNSVRLIKDDSNDPGLLTDLDGNVYRTTKIGDQVWLADNWACTKLNDGTPIPNVTDDTSWATLITGAYCNYNNDISNVFLP